MDANLYVLNVKETSPLKGAFVVGIDPIASWRDMVTLAAVPVIDRSIVV